VVSVSNQRLYLYNNGGLDHVYTVSTSRYGVGNEDGSLKTPLGVHRVIKKIGAGAPSGTVFKHRKNTNKIARICKTPIKSPYDLITTRILQLEGLEPGINRGRGIDTRERNVYIYGTHEEGLIGQRASIGCVRMRNVDVIELFEKMKKNSLVVIVD
jgi:lipoprotein-anchoring transpeptidase ErfK/SrfK